MHGLVDEDPSEVGVSGRATRQSTSQHRFRNITANKNCSRIYQGDTLCPSLFIMCVNPMSWKLRTLPGYTLTKPLNINISHGLFIDDLKLYSSSERQQGIKLALSHQMMGDMGLSMATKKPKPSQWQERDVWRKM